MHLLDANALIALGWPAHEHHEAMHAWFARHARRGWGSCALTQGAFMRIISQSAFAGRALAMTEVAEVLLRNLAHPAHRLVALDFSFDEVLRQCTGGLVGHRQVSDAFLLTAAIRSGMRLLTFDHGIRQLLATEDERRRHIAAPNVSAAGRG